MLVTKDTVRVFVDRCARNKRNFSFSFRFVARLTLCVYCELLKVFVYVVLVFRSKFHFPIWQYHHHEPIYFLFIDFSVDFDLPDICNFFRAFPHLVLLVGVAEQSSSSNFFFESNFDFTSDKYGLLISTAVPSPFRFCRPVADALLDIMCGIGDNSAAVIRLSCFL